MLERAVARILPCLVLMLVLTLSAPATSPGQHADAREEKSSLLGSPEGWVGGPLTGFPSMIGFRIERVWQGEGEEWPSWLLGVDFVGAFLGARVAMERRIGDTPFYAGLGGRATWVAVTGYGSDVYNSASVPVSYRIGTSAKDWSTHISLSAELFANDAGDWMVWPALQVSFLTTL